MAYGPKPEGVETRFWRYVKKTEECWVWTAFCDNGYGKLSLSGPRRSVWAHRVSWELHFGEIPPGQLVCHHCDNPSCVRPDHLFLGTHGTNAQDKASKDRAPFGEDNPKHVLTEAQVIAMRDLYAAGGISQRAVGKLFGVTQMTVSRAVRGQTWARARGGQLTGGRVRRSGRFIPVARED